MNMSIKGGVALDLWLLQGDYEQANRAWIFRRARRSYKREIL